MSTACGVPGCWDCRDGAESGNTPLVLRATLEIPVPQS